MSATDRVPSRAAGWQPLAALRCPSGHGLTRRDSIIEGALVVRCECGRALFVLATAATYGRVPLEGVAPPDVLLAFALEVTAAEAAWIAKARPSALEVFEATGLLWRPAATPSGAPNIAPRTREG